MPSHSFAASALSFSPRPAVPRLSSVTYASNGKLRDLFGERGRLRVRGVVFCDARGPYAHAVHARASSRHHHASMKPKALPCRAGWLVPSARLGTRVSPPARLPRTRINHPCAHDPLRSTSLTRIHRRNPQARSKQASMAATAAQQALKDLAAKLHARAVRASISECVC